MADQPNMVSFGYSMYLVRSQAGFRKAVKHWLRENAVDSLTYRDVTTHPGSYPALIRIVKQYRNDIDFVPHCLLMHNLFHRILPYLDEVPPT